MEHILTTISGILIKKCSDHQPYFILIDNLISNNLTPTFVTVTKQDAESQIKFQEKLEESANINSLAIHVNINYNALHNLIQASKELQLPSKLVRFNKYKHNKANGFHVALENPYNLGISNRSWFNWLCNTDTLHSK